MPSTQQPQSSLELALRELTVSSPISPRSTCALVAAAARSALLADDVRALALAAAFLAAAAAAANDGNRRRRPASADDAGELLLRCDVAGLLADALAASGTASDGVGGARRRVLAHAAAAAADLASGRLAAEAKLRLANAGAVEALLAALSGAGASAGGGPVALQACRALGNLCFGLDDAGGSECKRRVALAGGATLFVAALRRALVRGTAVGAAAAEARWALHALSNFVYGRAPNEQQALAASAGAIDAALEALAASASAPAAGSGDARLAAGALTALANLAFRHERNAARASLAGAAGAARAALAAALAAADGDAAAASTAADEEAGARRGRGGGLGGARHVRTAEAALFLLAALAAAAERKEAGDGEAERTRELADAALRRFGGSERGIARWAGALLATS